MDERASPDVASLENRTWYHTTVAAVVIAALATLTLIIVTTIRASAQAPAPTPTSPGASPTPDVDSRLADQQRRIEILEAEQTAQIASLNSSNDQYRFLLSGFGGILILVVTLGGAVQAYFSITQSRRERDRDVVQADGAQTVTAVMEVIRGTLQSRLDAETAARAEAEDLRNQVGSFLNRLRENLKRQRQAIEDVASELATVARHDFRYIPDRLEHFAQLLDEFTTVSAPLEDEPRLEFSARTHYIRGIAAHYSNDPVGARRELQLVVAKGRPEQEEPPDQYQSRVANAYYYLGVTDSNFGRYENALISLDHATKGRPQGSKPDFLTRIVIAEASLMTGNFSAAADTIATGKGELREMVGPAGVLPLIYLRLQSRLSLIEVNGLLRQRGVEYLKDAERSLHEIHVDSPDYYYATVALGQVCSRLERPEAQALYHNCYVTIQNSNDLLNLKETRSLILLQMVAGICCRNDPEYSGMADYHLNVAESLLNKLPTMDAQTCTVFSTLSKSNEQKAIIQEHINRIRKGEVILLPGDT